MSKKKNEIFLFEDGNVKLEVNMQDETVWLNLGQMSYLFVRDKSVVSRHIKNIYVDLMKYYTKWHVRCFHKE